MGRVHQPRIDRVCVTKGEALHSLYVSRLSGDEDVGRRKEGWGLITIDKVTAIQVVLCVDGVINPCDELVIRHDRRDGVGNQSAS